MKKYIWIVFAIMMLCILLLIKSDSQPAELRKDAVEGKPFCFVRDVQYWSQLTDYCVKDNCLYVLFGDVGVLKIYDLNGQYIRSYAYRTTKGASSLRMDSEYVYLFDQGSNYYTFASGEWVGFAGYSDYKTYLEKTDTLSPAEDQRKTDDAQYDLRFASIYRKNADGSSTQVLHRPLYLMFFQGALPFAVISFWLIILWLLKAFSRKTLC